MPKNMGTGKGHQKSGSYGDKQTGPTKIKTPVTSQGKATGMKRGGKK